MESSTRAVTSKLVVSPLPVGKDSLFKSKRWKLERSVEVRVAGKRFSVPAGFEFDFASVPRPFKLLFPDDAIYSFAAAFHDYFYQRGTTSKWLADALFYELLVCVDRVPKLSAFMMWLGVVLGGWPVWRKYRQRDRQAAS
jgi:hypothetical protein